MNNTKSKKKLQLREEIMDRLKAAKLEQQDKDPILVSLPIHSAWLDINIAANLCGLKYTDVISSSGRRKFTVI